MVTTSYFFNGNENIQYNEVLDKSVEGFPIRSSINWNSLPINYQSDIDDIINANEFLYFFKKDKYIKFSLITEKVVEGPAPIANGWPGLAGTGFETGIDTAAEWPDLNDRSDIKTVLFTKGAVCIIYNINNHSIYKTDIKTQFSLGRYPNYWSNIDTIFLPKSVNAVFAYIFKGNYYLRYDLARKIIDIAEKTINGPWHGVTFTQIQASVSVDNDVMGSCCQCGEVENGRYDFQISPDAKFGLIAYANSMEPQIVSVYVDNKLVDVFRGEGDGNTVIGIGTYQSGAGNIGIHLQQEGSVVGRLNFSNNRLESKARSITVSTESYMYNGVPDCTVIINTPLS